jgi:hypothetical protein
VWLAALPLCASTIDVSSQTQVTLGPGDALAYTFSTSSYLTYAARYRAPEYPARIAFTFITTDLVGPGDFTAELQSADGLTSVAFDNLAPSLGLFHGAAYNGPAATVSGSAYLAADLAAEVFSGPAVLVLHSARAGAGVGLPPYRLTQTMLVSLSGGGLSVGGMVYGVSLDQAPAGIRLSAAGAVRDATEDVPEPDSGLLLAGGGALLCGLGAALKRLRRSRI